MPAPRAHHVAGQGEVRDPAQRPPSIWRSAGVSSRPAPSPRASGSRSRSPQRLQAPSARDLAPERRNWQHAGSGTSRTRAATGRPRKDQRLSSGDRGIVDPRGNPADRPRAMSSERERLCYELRSESSRLAVGDGRNTRLAARGWSSEGTRTHNLGIGSPIRTF
jgi:hypothetical protein